MQEGEGETLPILRPFDVENSSIPNDVNTLRVSVFSYDNTEICRNIQESQINKEKEEGEEEGEVLPILRPVSIETGHMSNDDNELRSASFSYDKTSNWADDIKQ